MFISVPWTRLIRFKALETEQIHIGEPVEQQLDVGLALKNQQTVRARELLASSILDTSAAFCERVLTVVELVCPLRARHDTLGIYCYGINYKAHAEEANVTIGINPTSFIKPVTALNGPWPSPIKVPKVGQNKGLDYEAELAVIIGKAARDVMADDALDYILGYTAANDVSTRVNQVNNVHWCMGKGLDSFCPIGPAVVSQQSIKDPSRLYIEGRRNGVIKQKSELRYEWLRL
jgi:2-keto-4-pentenoate hydratase/2-oxohepta-3-ene-1,7-dioic acid hydratase in catechol pathway